MSLEIKALAGSLSDKFVKDFSASEENRGAHYYVYTCEQDVTKHTSIEADIIIPESIRLIGDDGRPKNAYISLGVLASDNPGDSVDFGISCTDVNKGWHPAYQDVIDNNCVHLDGLNGRRGFNVKTPAKAHVTVAPNPNDYRKILFEVIFYDRYNRVLNRFMETITVVPREMGTNCWRRYYRFASLLENDSNPMNDSTYMVKGKFANLKINDTSGSSIPWGIDTTEVQYGWIVGFNKCQILSDDANGETFTIDHWAD